MLRVLRLLKPQRRRDVETVRPALEDAPQRLVEAGVPQATGMELSPDTLVGSSVITSVEGGGALSAVVTRSEHRPSHRTIERFAMVCFLEEIDYAPLPLDPESFELFRGFFERLQGLPRLDACVLCWEALAQVGGDEAGYV